jgi:hypothetical protein
MDSRGYVNAMPLFLKSVNKPTVLLLTMSFNPLLQLNIKFVFGRFGMFEMLQFDTSGFSQDISLNSLVSKIKELRFFESSHAYQKLSVREPSNDKGEFGNYIINAISGEDYAPILTHELISKLNFSDPGNEYFISMAEVHHLISHNIRRHTGESVLFYELTIPPEKKEKLVSSPFWDNFMHFLGVDRKRRMVHMITTGVD